MNEGQVRVGSRTFEIGRLRSSISLVAGLALGAGLAVGVVSAAPHRGSPELTGLAERTSRNGRFVAGRITEIDGDNVTIALSAATTGASVGGTDPAPIPTRVVHLVPQTRAPAQRLRTGDYLLAVGRPEGDGSLTARAVSVRRPGQPPRRQAAPTTTFAPDRA